MLVVILWLLRQAAATGQGQPPLAWLPGAVIVHIDQVCKGCAEGLGAHPQMQGAAQGLDSRPCPGMHPDCRACVASILT